MQIFYLLLIFIFEIVNYEACFIYFFSVREMNGNAKTSIATPIVIHSFNWVVQEVVAAVSKLTYSGAEVVEVRNYCVRFPKDIVCLHLPLM